MPDTSTNSWKLLYESGRQALQARKLQEAEQSFSAALQLAEDFAPGDPRLAATLNALARIYSLQRRYLAAAALLNRLLEVTERTLGGNHVQVAGVLTNLAEMYTHLGAAREELELRERVLAIRADDPNADATSLERLREHVTELRAQLAAQEPAAKSEDEADFELLPIVRTAEYSTAPAIVQEPEVAAAQAEPEPVIEMGSQPATIVREEIPTTSQDFEIEAMVPSPSQPMVVVSSFSPSSSSTYQPAPMSVPVQPASFDRYAGASEPDEPMIAFHTTADHGFSDMGRDELASPIARKLGSRNGVLSIAAGVLLVAGILAARSFVGGGGGTVSPGSVSLASAATPAAAPTPIVSAAETADTRSAERLAADRRAERETKRVNEESSRESTRPATSVSTSTPNETRERESVIAPRVPVAADVEKALRGLDGAVKTIDLRTKAVTDSATAIRLQAPTFKKSKLADP
ncbi:MAG TPA: tetratricopeptide repeat protein [Gemmatimonadaceae bacterium]|nr:tetratricopeptide repeat protein [Gemmatimonadaceae bacterium]